MPFADSPHPIPHVACPQQKVSLLIVDLKNLVRSGCFKVFTADRKISYRQECQFWHDTEYSSASAETEITIIKLLNAPSCFSHHHHSVTFLQRRLAVIVLQLPLSFDLTMHLAKLNPVHFYVIHQCMLSFSCTIFLFLNL